MKVLFSLVFCLLLAGCGADGAGGSGASGGGGTVSVKHQWVGTMWRFWDDNPGTSSFLENDVYYVSDPGTYSFDYTAWDNSYWSGSYTLSGSGDGSDVGFILELTSSGPNFRDLGTIAIAQGIETSKESMPAGLILLGSVPQVIEKTVGHRMMRVKFRRLY